MRAEQKGRRGRESWRDSSGREGDRERWFIKHLEARRADRPLHFSPLTVQEIQRLNVDLKHTSIRALCIVCVFSATRKAMLVPTGLNNVMEM